MKIVIKRNNSFPLETVDMIHGYIFRTKFPKSIYVCDYEDSLIEKMEAHNELIFQAQILLAKAERIRYDISTTLKTETISP